ncbi:MAG: UDP-N-acetylglucosamine 2-epimerase (non-hydrolyzing) [Candidatus Zambryskibacteria bacterium]|nr:UDP-N-acetylglucosamine 2-epimerase (non-hydrolyzing) [Candidatus Zambryskibacteria bacterium]
MKIALILGTRPEIIKMSPIIRECERCKYKYFVLHTGQHYSKNMDEDIFDDLDLDKPKYNLGIGNQPFRKQIGFMTKEIGKVLKSEKPSIVLVQGDTISVLTGALAASKLKIKIGHHEAGLRSHDITMPEETNRVITDHISDFLFVPTPDALKNLHQEGCDTEKIYVTGNTIVDAVYQNIKIAEKKVKVLKKFNLIDKGYCLVTTHRAENVDDAKRLQKIFDGLSLVEKNLKLPIILPIHPRTKIRIKEFGISVSKKIKMVDPVGFLEFLSLENHARLILTDSGGVQEEAFILKIPCVTLRDNTERPETVEYKSNIVAGVEPEKILEAAKEMLKRDLSLNRWNNPFGEGNAGKKIVEIIAEKLNK